MERLKELLEEIWEEYEGAAHYSKKAAEWEEKDAAAASTYHEMAKQEMTHAQNLYDMAERCVQKHMGDPNGHDWTIIWDWEKGKLMDRRMKVKNMLEQ